MDTWPKSMKAVATELQKRGELPAAYLPQQAIAAAERVTGIMAAATDSLDAVATRWVSALALALD